MSGCAACGRALYYSERVAWPQAFCRPCAGQRGLFRLADKDVYRTLNTRAAQIAPWWRWSVFMEHAMLWDAA